MKQSSILILLILVLGAGAAFAAPEAPADEIAAIVFEKGTSPAEMDRVVADVRGEILYRFRTFPGVLFRTDPGLKADLERSLAGRPGIKAVQAGGDMVPVGLPPNDEFFDRQWSLHNEGQAFMTGFRGAPFVDVDAKRAWTAAHTGSAQRIVAIVDTGVDILHPDLADNLYVNPGEIPGNGIDDDGNGRIDDIHGWDFVGNDADPSHATGDTDHHGTHVAGIVGAVSNNLIGVAAANWQVQIMCLRIGTGGSVNSSYGAAAIDYAVAQGADVVNNSWGGTWINPLLETAIAAASDAGVLVVNCAQNLSMGLPSWDNDVHPIYPANFDYPLNLSVANSDHFDQLSSTSRYGDETVHLAAPGDQIYSTIGLSDPALYGYKSGTSMASPLVAAALAWILGYHNDVLGTSLDGLGARDIMFDRAEIVPELVPYVQQGRRLNMYRMVGTPDPTAPGPIDDLAVDSIVGKVINLSWTATGDDGTAGLPMAYVVYYSPNPIDFSSNYIDSEIIDTGLLPAGGTQTVSIDVGAYNRTRYFRVEALDEWRNYSGVSNEVVATSAAPPAFAIAPTYLAPNMVTGEVTTEQVTVSNTGGTTLVFTADPQEDWIGVAPAGGEVAPGDSMVLDVTIDAAGMCEPAFGYLAFASNDPGSGATFDMLVVAVVTPGPAAVDGPTHVDFGDAPLYSIGVQRIFIENVGCENLEVTALNVSNPAFSVNASLPFTVAPGAGRRLDIYFLANQLGRKTGTLSVVSNDPASPFVIGLEGMVVDGGGIFGKAGEELGNYVHAAPNPFNPATEFHFGIERAGRVDIELFDIRGRLVTRLGGSVLPAGHHVLPWNGTDRHGQRAASGTYFYRLLLDGNGLGEAGRVVMLK